MYGAVRSYVQIVPDIQHSSLVLPTNMSRTSIRPLAALLLVLFSPRIIALEVSPNSPCSSKCIDRNDGNPSWRNQSLTFNDMLPCYNWEYSGSNSTAAALKFQSCQECQLNSGYRISNTEEGTSYTEQDTTWFLCKFYRSLAYILENTTVPIRQRALAPEWYKY